MNRVSLIPGRNAFRFVFAPGICLVVLCIWFWMPWFRETFLDPAPPPLTAELQVPPAFIAAAPLWHGDGHPNQPTADDVAHFYSRWSHIDIEIARLPGHTWAGHYRSAYPATGSIVIAPSGGFALMESDVVGEESYRKPSGAFMSSGEVRELAGHLILNGGRILYPAMRGKCHYLLSGTQLEVIRRARGYGHEGDLLLRVGDVAETQDESMEWVIPEYAGDAADHGQWWANVYSLFRFRHRSDLRPIPEAFLNELPGSRGPGDLKLLDNEPPPPVAPLDWSVKKAPFFLWRLAALRKEVASAPGNSWAGNYVQFHGGSEPDSILIAPHRGALLTLHWVGGDISCGEGLFFADPVDEGMKLRMTNRRTLSFEALGRAACYETGLQYLYTVQIGERHFMLLDGEMNGLINRLNEQEVPDPNGFTDYFVRDGEQNKPLAGAQLMAASYAQYLHPSPLEGRVIAASPKLVDGRSGGPFNSMATCEQAVTLDVGSGKGVFEGMNLYAAGAKKMWGVTIAIGHVEAGKAEGTAEIASGFSCKDLPLAFAKPLQAGQKVSSRLPRR